MPNKTTLLSIGAAVLLVSSTPLLGSANAAQTLGGLSRRLLDNQCQAMLMAWPLFKVEPSDENDAFSWQCINTVTGRGRGMNFTNVCKAQYGRGAYAYARDHRDAYSWECRRN